MTRRSHAGLSAFAVTLLLSGAAGSLSRSRLNADRLVRNGWLVLTREVGTLRGVYALTDAALRIPSVVERAASK